MDAMKTRIGSGISPAELGGRLAAARRARGLAQETVAQHLGVSRPTVVAMEKGTRPPKPGELVVLAELFGTNIHGLVGERVHVPAFQPQFKVTQASNVPPEAIAGAVAEFQRVCEDYLTLETRLAVSLPPPRYPEVYSTDRLSPLAAAEEVAELERSRLGLGQRPILNLLDILENEVGIRVFVLPLAEFRIAGMFCYTERLGGCILVNGQHPFSRQLWSTAHEYGHFLSERYRSEVTVLVEFERKPRAEQFADCFAGSFLMPKAGLRQRFRGVVRDRADFTVADLCWLSDHYGVSVEAMTRRLESLNCIARGTWSRLSGEGFEGRRAQSRLGLAARNGRLRLPDRYRRLAVQAFEQDVIGESELLRFLRCSRVEAREAVEELTHSCEVDSHTGMPYQLDLNFGELVEVSPAERG
jgi:Zn-dependent peptidase ImmA (M78 family)/transcriptional regulator with XRE-family HTH domain